MSTVTVTLCRWWVRRHPLTIPQAEWVISRTIGAGKGWQPGPAIPRRIGCTAVWHYLYNIAGETLNQARRQESKARHPR